LESEGQLAKQVVVRLAGNVDPAWLGNGLEPGGDIHAVTIDVITVDDDIAKIDTDAKLDAFVATDRCVATVHFTLHLHAAAHGIDYAWELDQDAITGGLDHAATVLCDLRIDQLVAVRFKTCKRTLLIRTHEPTKAGHVRDQDRGQPSFDSRLGHQNCPKLGCLREASLRVGDGVSP